jgi:hypothetical protein
MSIFVAGDTALADGLNSKDYRAISELIGDNPLILNLEGPILPEINGKDTSQDKFKFNLFSRESSFINLLNDFNIIGVSLANNHFCDYVGGADFTLQILKSNDINYAGLKNKPYFCFEISGQKYLYYSFVSELTDLNHDAKRILNVFDYKKICDDIKLIKNSNEGTKIIVSPHWGYEGKEIPQEADKALARQLILHGADFIIGHHPHVIQSTEACDEAVFSVGNFILNEGPYQNKILKYNSSASKRFLVVEIAHNMLVKHLFTEQSKEYIYEGIINKIEVIDKTATPKGYPAFINWLSFRSKLFLRLLDIKKYIRKLLIYLRIHKPYNW